MASLLKSDGMLKVNSTWVKYLPFKNTLISEMSQTEEGKYCMVSIICGI